MGLLASDLLCSVCLRVQPGEPASDAGSPRRGDAGFAAADAGGLTPPAPVGQIVVVECFGETGVNENCDCSSPVPTIERLSPTLASADNASRLAIASFSLTEREAPTWERFSSSARGGASNILDMERSPLGSKSGVKTGLSNRKPPPRIFCAKYPSRRLHAGQISIKFLYD